MSLFFTSLHTWGLVVCLALPGQPASPLLSPTEWQSSLQLKNTSQRKLKDVLHELKERFGVDILFGDQLVQGLTVPKTALDPKASLEENLDRVLKNSGLHYRKAKDGAYLIVGQRLDKTTERELPQTSARSSSPVASQQPSLEVQDQVITGKVTDEKGEGLPGVNILLKGTSRGNTTDAEGNFKLTIPENADNTLVFSLVGYMSQEVAVGTRTTLDVQLKQDIKSLEEVVVIGYGTVKKSDVTGAVASIDSKNIEKVNRVDAASAIQGQVPGVMVQRTDNKPGSGGFNIRIRGASTIHTTETAANAGYTPGQNPLFIVDGIFVNDISFLNPADIDRMDVLKDASATAIYGSRGTNGVVIIQTKKGESGKLTVRYNNYVGVKEVYHLPPIYNTTGYVDYLKDVVVGNQYASGNYNFTRNDVNLPNYLNAEELKNINDGVSTNWIDLITRKGFQTNHTLDLSGGNKSTVYAIGFGYTQDKGTTRGEDFNRYTLRGNLSSDLTSWLNLSYNNYVTVATQNAGSFEAFRSAYRLKPIGRAYNEDGSLKFLPTAKETQVTNPLLDIENEIRETKYLNYLGDIAVRLKLVPGMTFTSKFSPNIKYTRYGEYRGKYTKSSVGNQSSTRAQVENYLDFSYTWDNIVNYDTKINDDNKINATFVYSQYNAQNESYALQVRNFSSDDYLFYNLGAGSTVNNYSSRYLKQTLESFTGRINYSLKDKYIFTVTGRYDGSSILAEGNKWAFFPSAAFAWRMIDEGFLKSQNLFSDAKLRLSYGKTGNNGAGGGLSPLGSLSLLSPSYTNINDQSMSTLFITGLANKNLTWEHTAEINVGLDFGLFKNRLTGSLDVYDRTTNNIIFFRPLPLATGFPGTYDNIGKASNRGVELGLNAVVIDANKFRWSVNLNFAANRNKVLKLNGSSDEIIFGSQGATLIHKVGQPMGSFYYFKANGIWGNDQVEEARKYGQKPGQVRVVDVDGDGQITESRDRMIIGNSAPKWTGGMTHSFTYKNFDLSVFAYTSQGAMAASNFHRSFAFAYDNEPARLWNGYRTDYWTPDNQTSNWFQPGNGGTYSSAYKYMDVSFVKVGYMTLGYRLPADLLSKARIGSLRVYATVQNPFTFTKYDGWDPENASRNDWGGAFMSRTYMAGLNLSF
ncbi:SusC/RagA family TonB-linked outer membrane protein [Siphonobacter sp. BAB-5405]|uniref:SusC/RagA family TonB-linked outer membrane protein n=1 Tax=Siphonobacter sp. BAB-5405 TaxID=1864825 RepID=UPI000C80BF76|nr:SusC/RagA family TonB-linked outer membrane protein [Siphonobacter sp. BAB-5405]PMD92291.1 SusC/RagA family TonB-linked outer membrane protein [Siphonobacter sp. BAB-5405]